MVQTESSSTMEGLQAQGSWILRLPLYREKKSGRGGLASSPRHTNALVYQLLPRLGIPFPLLVAGKHQLEVQGPARRSPSKVKPPSLPLERGSYNIYCSLYHTVL